MLTRLALLILPLDVVRTSRLENRRPAGFRNVVGFALLLACAACGADSDGSASLEQPICSPGQSVSCRCTDGTLPAPAGCAAAGGAAPAGASGAAAGSNAGAGSLAIAGRSAAGSTASGAAGMIATGAGRGGVTPTGTAGASGAPLPAAGSSAGGAAAAGSGGKPTGSAGSAAPSGDMGADCGDGGMTGKASNAGGSQSASGGGHVRMTFSSSNQILRLVTTLETPVKPNGNSTLFLWPGLEPLQGSPHYSPIGTGVLQPVMTWGGSCAPGGSQTRGSWWISAQYVNTLGDEPGFTGCKGGNVMSLATGDKVLIDMNLKGSVWNQTLTNMNGGKSVDFDFDLKMQEQRWAMFEIEIPTSTKPAADVVFTNTVITLEKPEPKSCQPSTRSGNDYYSAPISSADGLRCCYARIVLRAPGVAATTMDPAP